MRLPNLILAGAPKCATSSLYRWLAEHPDVAPASDKELFYVVDHDSPFRKTDSNAHDHGLEGYSRYFRNADPSCPWAIDGTTHTLYQESAIPFLQRLPEPPQIVVVVRRPSARVYSSFRFSQHTLARFRHPTTFAEFRQLVEQREMDALRRLVPFERSLYVLLRDVAYSQYLDWLEPWRHAFGESLHVLVFEEMRTAPKKVVSDLADRLGLDSSFFRDYSFSVDNVTVRPRHPTLHRMLRGVRRWVPKIPATQALYRHYLGLQKSSTEAPTTEDEDALRELDRHFAPFDSRLEQAFDLDLSAWRTP